MVRYPLRRCRQVKVLAVVVLSSLVLVPASAAVGAEPAAAPAATPAQPAQRTQPGRVAAPDHVDEPDRVLGKGWRTSTDRAVTASGDDTGFHLLVADEKDAYRWRTAATLSEPGWLTDQWIGQYCVTGTGRRAVVVYAPRQFTNRPELMDRGGYAAVVDLTSGVVTKLGPGASLAYYNPGCGVDETAVVSRLEEQNGGRSETWLGVVDTATGRLARKARVPGQLTSPVPFRGEVVGARGASLVAVDKAGRERRLAATSGTPFRVYPDAGGGVAFQTADDSTVHFHRFAETRVSDVGSAPRGSVKLRPGTDGRVFLAGYQATRKLPGSLAGGWRAVDTAPDSDISGTGRLSVSHVDIHREATASGDGAPDPVGIDARTVDGSRVSFLVRPQPGTGQAASPPPAAGSVTTDTAVPPYDFSNVPYEPDRICGISRNDPALQTYQPDFHQVEWAADLAVQNKLTFQRPANWSNNGLPAYSPQGLFPSIQLVGGGAVPAQVLLGILAQESNLWQASWHVVDGSAGNALTSLGYYGLDLVTPSVLDITWHDADPRVDCGYGVAQVTTGMRLDDRGRTVDGITITDLHQKAVALDYATNISAGLRILQAKWNETRNAGLIANDGGAQYIENWWFAIWAYNTGFWRYEDRALHNGSWGVGWANNPANPKYPADRQMFLTAPLDVPGAGIDDQIGYDNAKHPNHWSYPERVIGWAYTSLIKTDYHAHDYGPTYHIAALGIDKLGAQPGRFTFCAPEPIDQGGNECAPVTQNPNNLGDPYGPCTRPDLTCWWHYPKTWTSCPAVCGQQYQVYTSVDPRPFYDSIHPSQCTVTGLPAGVRIIDDIAVTQKTGPGGCTPNWTNGGHFSLKFGEYVRNGYTVYPSKADLHQIGAGFGGHFWFAHTMKPVDLGFSNEPRKVTGTWTIDPTNAWTRVFVHMPDHGAHTRQADYRIFLPGQTSSNRHRTISTRWEQNRWVDIGVFDFRGTGSPRVELSNFTADGRYVEDVAWDAIAVQPLAGKPSHFVVALGDSYSSGEGSGGYTRVSDQYGDDPASRNSCRRGTNAWARKIRLDNAPATLGELDDANDPRLDFQFLACSGARTHNVMRTTKDDGSPAPPNASGKLPGGSWGEVSQLDAGFLDGNTTLVMLTIGGNDAGWSDVAKTCAFETSCQNSIPSGETRTLREIVEQRIMTQVKPDVQRSINEIRSLAPNALIELAGYPQLFATTYQEDITWPGNNIAHLIIDAGELQFVTDVARLLSTEVLGSVSDPANRKIAVDVRAEFAGHELAGTTPPSYLNTWVPPDVIPDEDGDPTLQPSNPTQMSSMESFHPNPNGYQGYANVVGPHLAAFGYVW
jgi:hypothetical protein